MLAEIDQQRRRRSWFSYRLRTLLILTALIAAFLEGRASTGLRKPSAWRLNGRWSRRLPAGFVKPVTLEQIDDDLVIVSSGGVLSGTYRWRNNQLVVVDPLDGRMAGLVWQWDGGQFLLIGEPPDMPTGPMLSGRENHA